MTVRGSPLCDSGDQRRVKCGGVVDRLSGAGSRDGRPDTVAVEVPPHVPGEFRGRQIRERQRHLQEGRLGDRAARCRSGPLAVLTRCTHLCYVHFNKAAFTLESPGRAISISIDRAV